MMFYEIVMLFPAKGEKGVFPAKSAKVSQRTQRLGLALWTPAVRRGDQFYIFTTFLKKN